MCYDNFDFGFGISPTHSIYYKTHTLFPVANLLLSSVIDPKSTQIVFIAILHNHQQRAESDAKDTKTNNES